VSPPSRRGTRHALHDPVLSLWPFLYPESLLSHRHSRRRGKGEGTVGLTAAPSFRASERRSSGRSQSAPLPIVPSDPLPTAVAGRWRGQSARRRLVGRLPSPARESARSRPRPCASCAIPRAPASLCHLLRLLLQLQNRTSSHNKGLALAYPQGFPSLPIKISTGIAPFTLYLPRCCCSSIFLLRAFLSSRPFMRILILALRFRLSLALSPLINDMSSP
jgi:hypothetical protein